MDLDYDSIMEWFTNFDNAVRCRSREEIDELLVSIGKFGASDLSGSYDRVDESGIVYFARVRWDKFGVKIGYGTQDNINRHPEYRPIEFTEFTRKFDAANMPSLMELLEVS